MSKIQKTDPSGSKGPLKGDGVINSKNINNVKIKDDNILIVGPVKIKNAEASDNGDINVLNKIEITESIRISDTGSFRLII